ncbi:UNVERIFIED_CONTAM: protein SPIRAL1-like 1 [Sesamum radiatum]|uniref:Protein SPIRAL1-like 1 n=1 Tax=Sesamum radiatum TaxID=300843 RepID=A0AAW2S151_SESRA
MGRGVSSGGGQSSLGYLFGSGEAPKPAGEKSQAAGSVSKEPSAKPVEVSKQVPAGIHSSTATASNIFRADGQSSCNFITDRPSTKVHAAPGGGSSLGYLFGGDSN